MVNNRGSVINKDTDDFDSSPMKKPCQLIKDPITKLLSMIVAIKSDSKTWESLLLYMKKNKSKINNAKV